MSNVHVRPLDQQFVWDASNENHEKIFSEKVNVKKLKFEHLTSGLRAMIGAHDPSTSPWLMEKLWKSWRIWGVKQPVVSTACSLRRCLNQGQNIHVLHVAQGGCWNLAKLQSEGVSKSSYLRPLHVAA